MMRQVLCFVPGLYLKLCQLRVFGEFFTGFRLFRFGMGVANVWGNELLPQIMGGGFTHETPPTNSQTLS